MPSHKILIVEDEAITALEIKGTLEHFSYSVCAIASSGEDALEKIELLKPNLVLMDIKLKGEMNGIETAERIRNQFGIPVVYLTAYADKDSIKRASKTESYGFVYKPAQPDVLRAVIEMALYKFEMEKELREREARLQATLQSIGDAVISTDCLGNVSDMNPVASLLTGWNIEQAKGLPLTRIFNIVNAKTREEAFNPVEKVLREGVTVGLANHTVLIAKDGTEYQIADSAAPIIDKKGNVSGVVLVFRDVTEEYRIKEDLIYSEEKYRSLFDQSVEGIYVHNLKGQILDVNEMASRQTGYSKEELMRLNIFDLYPDNNQHANLSKEQILKNWKSWKPGERHTIEGVHQRKDGSGFPVQISTGVIEYGQHLLLAIVKDISEQKRMKEKIIGNHSEMLAIFNGIDEPVYIADIKTNEIIFANQAVKNLFGLPENKKCYEYLQNRESPCLFCTNEKLLGDYRGRSYVWEFQNPITGNWYKCIDKAISWPDSRLVRYEMAIDITERKLAEQALLKNQELLNTTQRLAKIGGWEWDVALQKMTWTDETYSIHGMPPGEIPIGSPEHIKKSISCYEPRYRPVIEDAFQCCTKEGKPYDMEFPFTSVDGRKLWIKTMAYPVMENGRVVKILGNIMDITERKESEQALKESDAKAQMLIQHSNDAIYLLFDRMFEFINPKFEEMFGYTLDEINRPDFDFIHLVAPQSKSAIEERIEKARRGEELPYRYEFTALTKDGLVKEVETAVAYMDYKGGKAVQGIIRDITERKQAEKDLRLSRERLDLAMFASDSGLWDWDIARNKVYFDPRYFTLAGYEPDEFPHDFQEWVKRVYPEDITDCNQAIENYMSGKTEKFDIEFRFLKKDGSWMWIRGHGKFADKDETGRVTRMIGTHTDITGKKLAEIQIQKNLKEKEALLKEIHHRVKNNMAVIISLLHLQSKKIKDKEQAVDAFDECCDRISAMAQVHEQLYKSDDFAAIDMKVYLNKMIPKLKRYCLKSAISFDLQVKDVYLGVDIGVPCGLIINELITNSCKHAFKGSDKGKILIDFRLKKDLSYQLIVQDDGIGLPKGIDIYNSGTLGLNLIRILTEQIEGTLEIKRLKKGTKFVIRFS